MVFNLPVGGGGWLPLHHFFFIFFCSLTKLSLPWPTSFLTFGLLILSPILSGGVREWLGGFLAAGQDQLIIGVIHLNKPNNLLFKSWLIILVRFPLSVTGDRLRWKHWWCRHQNVGEMYLSHSICGTVGNKCLMCNIVKGRTYCLSCNSSIYLSIIQKFFVVFTWPEHHILVWKVYFDQAASDFLFPCMTLLRCIVM